MMQSVMLIRMYKSTLDSIILLSLQPTDTSPTALGLLPEMNPPLPLGATYCRRRNIGKLGKDLALEEELGVEELKLVTPQ